MKKSSDRVWIFSVLKLFPTYVEGATACMWRLREACLCWFSLSTLWFWGIQALGLGVRPLFSWAILLAPKSHCLNRLKSKGFKAGFSCTACQRILGDEDRDWFYTRAATQKNMEIINIWQEEILVSRKETSLFNSMYPSQSMSFWYWLV